MKLIFPLIAAITIILSCNSKHKSGEDKQISNLQELQTTGTVDDGMLETGDFFQTDSTQPSSGANRRTKTTGIAQQPSPNVDWDKKIIKNATLSAEVRNYDSFSTSIRATVRELGGYIAQEEQQESDYKIENTLAIKVPVNQFDNAVLQLMANAQKIIQKKISSQEVSGEIIDTRSRMEAKMQARARYLELMKDAKNMQDILQVQTEINGIQEEIESAGGRIAYLGHSASFSTIHLTYFQVLNAIPKEIEKPGFGTQVAHAFRTGWSWISDLFVALVSIWPMFLLIFAIVFFYKKVRFRKPNHA